MKLKLKNIGKIREAEINIEGITVIAGENNTGKSTVGKTLYALCNAFHDVKGNIREARISSIAKTLQVNYAMSLSLRQIHHIVHEEIDELLKSIPGRREIIKGLISQFRARQRKTLLAEGDESEPDTITDEKAIKRIEQVLNLPYEMLVASTVLGTFDMEFRDKICYTLNQDNAEIELSEKDKSLYVKISDNVQHSPNDNLINVSQPFFQTDKAIYIDNAVDLFETEASFNHQGAFRRAWQAKSENVNPVDSIIARKEWAGILNIINQICKGDLIKDNFGDWRYREKESGKSFLLQNVSTGILAFAILKRLIENGSLQENGVLILDEPETHLHPEWQINFAEVIVLLHQEFNFRILINTHSYYFLHALEVFSWLHKVEAQCRFYLAEADGDMAVIEDVTGYTDKIYEKLWKPVKKLKEIEAKLDGEDTGYEDE